MSARSYLSIGDVLTLLRQEFPDVTISKIRFLESQGLVNPERTPSGYRKFYEHDIDRLKWVLRQQREHFLPLKVIKDRLDDSVTSASLAGSGAATSRGASRRSAAAEGVTPSGQGDSAPGAASIGSSPAGSAPAHPDAVIAEGRGLAAEGRDDAAHFATDEPVLAARRGGGSRLQDTSERGPGAIGDRRRFDDRSGSTTAERFPTSAGGDEPAASEHTHPGPTSASADGSPTGSVSAPGPAGAAGPGVSAASSAAARQGAPPPGALASAQATGSAGSDPAGGGRRRSKRGSGGGRNEEAGSPGEPSADPPAGTGDTTGADSSSGSSRTGGRGAGGTAEKGETVSGVDLNGATLSVDELATESGLEIEMVRELESFGLLHASSVAGVECYDEEALVVALAAAGFARFGVEPRHLRLYKNAADREAGFVEQIVLPLVRQRNPEARVRAEESADELARLGQQLRSSLLRTALGDLLDS